MTTKLHEESFFLDFMDLEDGTDGLSRKVVKLPLYNV
jgi:hypothetical protein